MEITWDHAKQVQVGTGLVNVMPGEAFEMPDEEALNRLASGEIGLNAAPSEVKAAEARVKKAAKAADAPPLADPTAESPEAVAAVSEAPSAPEAASKVKVK